MIFSGLEAIDEGEPESELRAEGEAFDLHYCASLRAVTYEHPETLSFLFLYGCEEVAAQSRNEVELRFRPIKDLKIEQVELGFPPEPGRLSHITYYHEKDTGLGLFQLFFMDGLDINFRTGSMTFRQAKEVMER